jgi:hypothetical protein
VTALLVAIALDPAATSSRGSNIVISLSDIQVVFGRGTPLQKQALAKRQILPLRPVLS